MWMGYERPVHQVASVTIGAVKVAKKQQALTVGVLGSTRGRPWEDVPEWDRLSPRDKVVTLISKPLALKSHGAVETLVVAMDELLVPGAGGGLVKIPPQADAAALLQTAETAFTKNGVAPNLVFYPPGAQRNEGTRRVLNGRVLLHGESNSQAMTLAAKGLGCGKVEALQGLPGFMVVEDRRTPGASLVVAAALSREQGIESAQPLLAGWLEKAATPTKAKYFKNQWHLQNTGQLGATPHIDANVLPAWTNSTLNGLPVPGVKGKGVVIGIVDDAIQVSHPDLAPNYLASASVDLVPSDEWAGRSSPWNYHSSCVAGVAAASGTLGVAGTAPEASIAGIWLLAENTGEDEVQEALALTISNDTISIKNNSWTKRLTANTLGTLGELVETAMETATTQGRGGKGEILVFAAGNAAEDEVQGNKSGFANNIHAIAVGAVAATSMVASYSEQGAHLLTCAPSSGGIYDPWVVTVDRFTEPLNSFASDIGLNEGGDLDELEDVRYTRKFSGTSSAAALTSGVIALMLEANPSLGWRDVKEILLRSGTVLQPSDPGWVSRTGGRTSLPRIRHHHQFGGGMINAGNAVALARTWENLGADETRVMTSSERRDVPDGGENGPIGSLEVPFQFSDQSPLRVETVEVKVDMRHTARGDVSIDLISPSGTVSHLAYYSLYDRPEWYGDPAGYENWTFSSARHWGESSVGKWKVVFTDQSSGETGYVQEVTIRLHGVSAPAASIDVLASTQDTIFPLGSSTNLQVVASGLQDRTIQWLKGNTSLAIGARDTLALSKMTAATSGTYTVKVSNLTGEAQTSINVGVVDANDRVVTINDGVARLDILAVGAGPGITCHWTRNGVPMEDNPPRITGTRTLKLSILSPTTTDVDDYACKIQVGRATRMSGVTTLQVRVKPRIADFDFEPAIVSGNIALRVPFLDTAVGIDGVPTSFRITGLPSGVTYNPTTGWITGAPLAAVTKPIAISITATNAAGSTTVSKLLTIAPLSSNNVGTFNGLASADAVGNNGLGGTINVVCASTGVFSGKLVLGAQSYGLAGRLDAALNRNPKALVNINRPGKKEPMVVAFELSRTDGHLTGTVTDARAPFSMSVEGWLNPYTTLNPASHLAATYNAWIELPASSGAPPASPPSPEGVGCASLALTSLGGATWIDRLADGTVLVGYTTLGSAGDVPMHFLLYGGTGSIHGWARASEVASPGVNTLAGSLRWVKNKQATGTTLSYPEGFNLDALALTGECYVKPAKGTVLWGLQNLPGQANAELLFSRAGIESSGSYTSINAKGLKLPAAPGTSLVQTVLVIPATPAVIQMVVNSDNGWFSGTASLRETPTSATIRRLTFTGISRTGAGHGKGYFTVPALSSPAPVLSGALDLMARP